MQTIYNIIFLCLLRFDEILHIQHYYIKIFNKNEKKIEIIFDFRKTHQMKNMCQNFIFVDFLL